MEDLQKEYELDVWDKADVIDHKNGRSYIYIGFARWLAYWLKRIKSKNTQLKSQLTWRPVSEKPENAGWIVCKRWATSKKQDIWYVTELYLICTDDEWKHFVERDGIISYRPIPPAPQGE